MSQVGIVAEIRLLERVSTACASCVNRASSDDKDDRILSDEEDEQAQCLEFFLDAVAQDRVRVCLWKDSVETGSLRRQRCAVIFR